MSVDPIILRAMQASGCTMDQIIAVVEADAARDEERRASKRANNRERQQRYRNARNALHDVTRVTNCDMGSPLPPPLKDPPDPLKITPPISPLPPIGARAKLTRLGPPEGVSAEQFTAFRQQRKKTLTDHAYTLLCNKLKALAEAGYPPGDMIDLAIERGWETVFEPKGNDNGYKKSTGGDQNGNGLRGSRPNPALDLYRQGLREMEEDARRDQDDHGQGWPALPSPVAH